MKGIIINPPIYSNKNYKCRFRFYHCYCNNQSLTQWGANPIPHIGDARSTYYFTQVNTYFQKIKGCTIYYFFSLKLEATHKGTMNCKLSLLFSKSESSHPAFVGLKGWILNGN